jgi:hypothetical protein
MSNLQKPVIVTVVVVVVTLVFRAQFFQDASSTVVPRCVEKKTNAE